jgi:methionine-gamma-lyase
MNAWLALTGMQTLTVRMDKYSENAMAIAEFLESHKKIEEVMYPGLKSHPAHKIAKKQMSGFGGLLALKVKGKKAQAAKFVNSTKVCERIINLGQNTTLICHPATTTNSELNEEELKEAGISGNFVRISVGLEDENDLINDLEQALRKI